MYKVSVCLTGFGTIFAACSVLNYLWRGIHLSPVGLAITLNCTSKAIHALNCVTKSDSVEATTYLAFRLL